MNISEILRQFEEDFQSIPDALCVRDFRGLKDGAEIPIRVVIYPPRMEAVGPMIRYTIAGEGIAIDEDTGGMDRLDAILNAFYAVRFRLEELPFDVTWTGLPRRLDLPKKMGNGTSLHFERYCEELLGAEHAWANTHMRDVKRLWGEAPGRRYEDCEGYRQWQAGDGRPPR